MSELISANNLYQEIIDHSADGIFVCDKNLRCLVWNRRLQEMTGIAASYIVGRDSLEVFPSLREREKASRNLIQQVLNGNTVTVPGEAVLVPQSGNRFWISGLVAPHRNQAGEIIGMVAFLRDITARKMANEVIHHSENRYLRLLDSVNDAMWRFDNKNLITFVNRRMTEILGYSLNEMLGEDGFSFVHPDDRAMAKDELMARQLKEKGPFEVRLLHKNGATQWMRTTATAILGDYNQYLGMQGIMTDVSETRKVQASLEHTAYELSGLYNQAPCGYHSLDADGVIIKINDTELSWLGYQRDEVIGKMHIRDILSAASYAHFQKAFNFFKFDDGTIRQIEYEVKRRDGTTFIAQATSRAVLDENKKFVHSHTSLYDITEAKAAQIALEQNEARYRQMFENHPAIQLLVNPEAGTLVDGNPAAAAFYGYSAQELRGMSATKIDIMPREEILQEMALAKSGGKQLFDLRHKLASGELRDVQIHAAPLVLDGQCLIYCIVYDITEKKLAEIKLFESEAHYRDLIENAEDIIYETDAMGHFIFLNEHTEKVLKYTSAEAVGRHYLEAVRPDWRDRVQSFYMNQFINKIPTSYFEFPVVTKDGQVIWLGQNVRMVIENGRAIKHQAFCRDITERRKWEAEIENSRAQLRDLSNHLQTAREAERSRISREIHDELGAALTALKMDLSWQANQLRMLDDRQYRLFTDLVGKVDGCIGTVRKIATDLRPSILDNLGLWAAIEWQAQQLQSRMNIVCEVKMSVQDLDMQQEEATAIFRILQETLTNVARHSKATRVTIQVDATDQEVHMEISDNGKGMPEHKLENFASLGLLGMYERARTFGGEFSISSKLGQGTVVSVQMPVSKPAPAAAEIH